MKFYFFPEGKKKGSTFSKKINIKEVSQYLHVFPNVGFGSDGLFINKEKVELLLNNLNAVKLVDSLDKEQSDKFKAVMDYLEDKYPQFGYKDTDSVTLNCLACIFATAIINNQDAVIAEPQISFKEETMKKTTSTSASKLIERANNTLNAINDRVQKNQKATLNQLRAMTKQWVGMHRIHNRKDIDQATVDALRMAMQKIGQFLVTPSKAIGKYESEQILKFGQSQMARCDQIKNEGTVWEKFVAMLVTRPKGVFHGAWTVATVVSHRAYEWTVNTAWPALRDAASDVWDWCRNLFASKPKVEVSTGTPPQGDIADAVLVA